MHKVHSVLRSLLNTIRQGDYYLITDDFDSCEYSALREDSISDALSDIEALRMVDEAYNDRTEWIKKSIRTTAKVWIFIKDITKGRL